MKRLFPATVLLLSLSSTLSFGDASTAPELDEVLALPANSGWLDTLTGDPETMNKVTLLHLGARSRPMRMKLLKEAKHYVFITVPYWFDDKEGNRFFDVVKQRREPTDGSAKLDVRVLMDWTSPVSSGDFWGRKIYRRLLKATGGETLQWNRIWNLRPWSLGVLKNRIHDKIFVVDGRALIMGGMNFADEYLEGGLTAKGWHDSDLLIEGPAAQSAAKMFLRPYLLQAYLETPTNPFPSGEHAQIKALQDLFFRDDGKQFKIPMDAFLKHPWYFPKLEHDAAATSPVRLIYDNPLVTRNLEDGEQYSRLMDTLEFIVPKVKRSMRLFVPYLTTTKRMNRLLIKAAKSGIKVEIITNSLKSHDLGDINYKAAILNFAWLHQRGVEIYEWQGHEDLLKIAAKHGCTSSYWPGRTLHTKAAILDGRVVLLGSHNFNVRSETMNSEIMALVRDPRVAKELNDVFEFDLDRFQDAPGIRTFTCGNEVLSERPRRVRKVTRQYLQSVLESQSLWIQFLHLFQWIM